MRWVFYIIWVACYQELMFHLSAGDRGSPRASAQEEGAQERRKMHDLVRQRPHLQSTFSSMRGGICRLHREKRSLRIFAVRYGVRLSL